MSKNEEDIKAAEAYQKAYCWYGDDLEGAFLAGIAHARRWIPVSEGLPDVGTTCLIKYKYLYSTPYIAYADRTDKGWRANTEDINGRDYDAEHWTDSEVIAWQPIYLPEE